MYTELSEEEEKCGCIVKKLNILRMILQLTSILSKQIETHSWVKFVVVYLDEEIIGAEGVFKLKYQELREGSKEGMRHAEESFKMDLPNSKLTIIAACKCSVDEPLRIMTKIAP
jgi:hypothetical protein